MPHIMIDCPSTGRPMPTGFDASQEQFQASEYDRCRSGPCPHCGQMHTWSKQDAYLEGQRPTQGGPRQP
jgi:hypothetical protein